MISYEVLSDEELITLVRAGDDDALNYLMNKFKHIVRKRAKALFLIGGDRDDLIQEGMIGLYKAIRDYNSEKAASFPTFAELVISRQIYTAINNSKLQKNLPLNNYIPIELQKMKEETTGTEAFSYANNEMTDPEALFIDRETVNRIELMMKEKLSEFEQQVMDLYLQDYSYDEIAVRLQRQTKAIDNAVQRIKKKVFIIL